MLFKIGLEIVFGNLVSGGLGFGIVEFGFGLRFELDFGAGHLDPDNGSKALF